jgi:colanic acid/amylovoran biosynthesis glycosyltransferase
VSLRGTTPPADGSRPRVVYVTASLPFGNSEHFVVPEIDELERQGIEIIVCPRKWQASTVAADRLHLVDRALEARLISPRIVAGAVRAFLRSPGGVARAVWCLRASRSPGVLAKNLAVVPKGLWLAEYVRAHGVRHLHAHWASTTATLAMLASQVSGVPFSFTAHRWDIAEDNLLATKVRAAAFARAIDRLGAEELASLARAKISEIAVIHMGVAAGGERAMRELATPPSVVIPASLIEIKGHTYLLQAVALLAERGTPVRLEIVGDGPERAPIEREIDSRRLRDLVVMRGFVSHDQLLQELEDGRYDIAVLPSAGTAADSREGIPVALMEALAAGVPAVGTAMGGIPELLCDGAGVLVPERSPGAIADAIGRLAADPAYRQAVVECGNARIRREFAIEPICVDLATRFLAG